MEQHWILLFYSLQREDLFFGGFLFVFFFIFFAFIRLGATWAGFCYFYFFVSHGTQSGRLCFWLVSGRLFCFPQFGHSASFAPVFLLFVYQPPLSLSLYTMGIYRLPFSREIHTLKEWYITLQSASNSFFFLSLYLPPTSSSTMLLLRMTVTVCLVCCLHVVS